MNCHPRHKLLQQAPRLRRGFTLIEVVIVVSIIAILSAVAYPSYRDYLRRGQLADATNGLSVMRAQMERHFQDNRSYATVSTFTTPCAAAVATRTFGLFGKHLVRRKRGSQFMPLETQAISTFGTIWDANPETGSH